MLETQTYHRDAVLDIRKTDACYIHVTAMQFKKYRHREPR
jgi:hypothetical protein